MTDHATHPDHVHTHEDGCGHRAMPHAGHTDYLHEGHLHHQHGDHVDEHELPDDAANPAACTPEHTCAGRDGDHEHGDGRGHDAVPHTGHTDYLVGHHLHHAHAGHCDEHGAAA